MSIVLSNDGHYLTDTAVDTPCLDSKVIVICGFPGIGKSSLGDRLIVMPPDNHLQGVISEWEITDLESSHFDKAHFPGNYVDEVSRLFEEAHRNDTQKIILCSSHKAVRDAFRDAGISFMMVYPDKSLKEEYIARYKSRVNHPMPLAIVEANWEHWIDELDAEDHQRTVLQSGQFLKDIFTVVA